MKQSLFLVIALVATLVLTACGGQESAEQTVVDMPTPIPTYTPQAVIDASQEGAPVPTLEAEATEKPSDETASAGETTAAAAGQAEETPTAEITATEEPTAEATATEEPTAEVTATEEPTAEVTATEEPTAEVTATEGPTAEVTATEEPTAEAIATEEPTTEATATEEPTAEPTPTEAAPEAAADPLAGLPAGVAAAMADADPGRGEQLTLQNGCTGCHSLDPDATMVGPTWHNLAETAANRIEGQSAAEYLYHSITDPNAYVVEGFPPNVMPQNYADILSDQDLADLITYLLNAEQ